MCALLHTPHYRMPSLEEGNCMCTCIRLPEIHHLEVITAPSFVWHVLWLSENFSWFVSTTAMSWQGCNKIEGSWCYYIYIIITYKSTEHSLYVSCLLVLCSWHYTYTLGMCPLPQVRAVTKLKTCMTANFVGRCSLCIVHAVKLRIWILPTMAFHTLPRDKTGKSSE